MHQRRPLRRKNTDQRYGNNKSEINNVRLGHPENQRGTPADEKGESKAMRGTGAKL